MSDATRVLSQLAYLELFKKHSKTAIDVKGWVANQNYLVAAGMTPASFTLTTHDSDGLRAALANDCNRMSMAAIESICGVQADAMFPKSSAWATIRSYYAAFFAAHALLRVFGYSYSQLESEHTKKIFEMAKALNMHGENKSIESGFYSIQIDKSFSTLIFEKKNESHKDMWRGFLALIDKLIADIGSTAAISTHKIQAQDLLMGARRGVTKNGSRFMGNWLSELRNQVNYQHLHGAWFPYEAGVTNRRIIDSATSCWKNPSDTFNTESKKKEMELFFESTSLLLSFLREMLAICIERTGDKGSVFQNGALRMMRTVGA